MRTQLMKSAGSAVSTGVKGVSALSNIVGSAEAKDMTRIDVFFDDESITCMEFFKMEYLNCFRESIEYSSLPAVLDSRKRTERHYLFWTRSVLAIKKSLTQSDLHRNNFKRLGLTSITSANRKLTTYLITEGVNYISLRESDFIRRGNLQLPFNNVQNSRYYFIYVISKMLLNFAKEAISEELVEEYRYLESYLTVVQEGLPFYFTNTRSRTGFHYYIRNTIETVQALRKNTEYWDKRKSIAKILGEVSKYIESYTENITTYLTHCISAIPMNFSVCLTHFEGNSNSLPGSFTSSVFFKLIQSALTDEVVILNSEAVSSSKCFAAEVAHLENSNEVVKNYLALVNLLNCLSQFSDIYPKMAEVAVDFGEDTFVRNENLRAILQSNLQLLTEYTSRGEFLMLEIEKANRVAVQATQKFKAGYSMNVGTAKKAYTEAYNFRRKLSKQVVTISDRVADLLLKEDPDIKAATSKLVKESAALLLKPQKQGVLQKSVIDRISMVLHSASDKQVRLKPTLERIQTGEIARRFPLAFQGLQNNQAGLAEFKTNVAAIEFEQKTNSIAFLDQVEVIYQLTFQLERLISSIAEADSSTRGRIVVLYHKLESIINKTHYHNHHINSFDIIDRLLYPMLTDATAVYFENIRENLKTYLAPNQGEAVQTKIMLEIMGDLAKQGTPIREKIEAISSSLKNIKLSKQQPILDYFKDKLNFDAKPEIISSVELDLESDGGVATLPGLIQQLFSATGKVRLKSDLAQLYQHLKSFPYKLNYFGGEVIQSNGESYKVPRNIKKILTIYEQGITTATTFGDYIRIRDSIFTKGSEAATTPPSYCFGIFKPRDSATQNIYEFFHQANVAGR